LRPVLDIICSPVLKGQKLCLPEAKAGRCEGCGIASLEWILKKKQEGDANCGRPLDRTPQNDYRATI
jgi:hypothetical protein